MATNLLGVPNSNVIVPYSAASTTPAGTIVAYSGSIAAFTSTSSDSTTIIHKDGWAVCNGASLSQTTYAELYARISTTWNTATNPLTGSAQSAPSSGYFRIPNLQGVFLRGVGDYAGADAYSTDNDVILAEYKVDKFQGHQHAIALSTAVGSSSNLIPQGTTYNDAGGTTGYNTDGSYGTPRVGKETNPKQIGVYYLVKLYDNQAPVDVYIPEADASTTGLVNTGAQSFAGDKTFQGKLKVATFGSLGVVGGGGTAEAVSAGGTYVITPINTGSTGLLIVRDTTAGAGFLAFISSNSTPAILSDIDSITGGGKWAVSSNGTTVTLTNGYGVSHSISCNFIGF